MRSQTPTGLIVVPARLESTRLPRKLLLAETGKPLLAHVLENAVTAVQQAAGRLRGVLLACDAAPLAAVAAACGVPAAFTALDHPSGTSRIAEAVERHELAQEVDFIINLQGDEPELAPAAILAVADTLIAAAGDRPNAAAELGMATLAVAMSADDEELRHNPNVVKVIFDVQGRAIYFSRSPIPYHRQTPPTDQPPWYCHLGIYAYGRSFLLDYARWPSSWLEQVECLEQLRVLQAGYSIQVATIPAAWAGRGIDTPADYEQFVTRQRQHCNAVALPPLNKVA